MWLQVIASPLIWLMYLVANAALVPCACRWQSHLPLMAGTLIAFAAEIASALRTRSYRRLLMEAPSDAIGIKRHRLLVQGGLWLSVLFALLIAAHGVVTLMMDPCQLRAPPVTTPTSGGLVALV
ncbi:MAG TPA: hypothetical protein VD994_16020 [Prosthecobacter sp.]|nr:hypothetical protein [Prosthecobacter sp.]